MHFHDRAWAGVGTSAEFDLSDIAKYTCAVLEMGGMYRGRKKCPFQSMADDNDINVAMSMGAAVEATGNPLPKTLSYQFGTLEGKDITVPAFHMSVYECSCVSGWPLELWRGLLVGVSPFAFAGGLPGCSDPGWDWFAPFVWLPRATFLVCSLQSKPVLTFELATRFKVTLDLQNPLNALVASVKPVEVLRNA